MDTPERDAIRDALGSVAWPDEFIVEYTDGTRERLLRGDGVSVENPADDPVGEGGFSAYLPKAHARHRDRLRFVSAATVRAILSPDGRVLWRRP